MDRLACFTPTHIPGFWLKDTLPAFLINSSKLDSHKTHAKNLRHWQNTLHQSFFKKVFVLFDKIRAVCKSSNMPRLFNTKNCYLIEEDLLFNRSRVYTHAVTYLQRVLRGLKHANLMLPPPPPTVTSLAIQQTEWTARLARVADPTRECCARSCPVCYPLFSGYNSSLAPKQSIKNAGSSCHNMGGKRRISFQIQNHWIPTVKISLCAR